MNMEFFQVRRYGEAKKEIKKTNFLGDDITIPVDTVVYFVNTKFSVPTCGFVMTAEGVVATKTTDFDGTNDSVRKIADAAKAKIAAGEIGNLEMKFNL